MPAIYTDRAQGVSTATAVKAPVRMATTMNIVLSGLQTIDGVVAEIGDRVLVKDQTTGTENGIWLASSGAWTRALDFNDHRDVRRGTLAYVHSGQAGGETMFEVLTADPVVIGTSTITFDAVAFGGAVSGIGAIGLWHDCGQSGSQGVHPLDADGNEPPDRAPAGVKVWDSVPAEWVGSSWKIAPWTRAAPHGSGLVTGCPNIGLSFVIRMQEVYGGARYLTHNARSGRSIEEWVGDGVLSSMYVEDKTKIEAALATPELTGVTKISGIIRTQSEEDYNRVFSPGDTFPLLEEPDYVNSYEVYRTYMACLELYLAQLKDEDWWGPDSVLILMGNSELHQRYMPVKALRDFAQLHPEVLFVSAKGMMTREDLADFTHFDGPSIDELGYRCAFAEFQQRGKPGDIAPTVGSFMQNRIGEPYKRGDDTIVFPPEAVLDGSLKKIAAARGSTKTIASGAITIDRSYFAVDTEAAASTDDLETIDGGTDGQVLVLRIASGSRTVRLVETGNLNLNGSTRLLTGIRSRIVLHYDAVVDEWTEIGFEDPNADITTLARLGWLAQTTVTSGTNAALASGIPSTVTDVYIRFRGVSTSGANHAELRLGTSGGLVASGYHGASGIAGTGVAFTTGFGLYIGDAARAISGNIALVRVGSTNTWSCRADIWDATANSMATTIGEVDLASALTQIAVYATGGDSFDATGAGEWEVGYR